MKEEKALHILYICPYYKPAYIYGGPVQVLATMSEELVRAGIRVTVFTTNANGTSILNVPNNQPVNVNNVTVWYFTMAFNGLGFYYSRQMKIAIINQIKEFNLVVVHSLWEYQLQLASNICKKNNIPFVVTVHGQLFPWALAQKKIKKKIYLELFARKHLDSSNGIQCTDFVEENAVAKIRLRPSTFVVPNAVCAEQYREITSSYDLREKFNLSKSTLILVFLGRITQIKRPDIAVDVIAAIQGLDVNAHLFFVGPDQDGLKQSLKYQSQELGCEDKIHFTGLLDKKSVIAVLSNTDLLLMPSEVQENFGMAALEALVAGVPILVSDGIPVGQWAQKFRAGRSVPCTTKDFQQAALEIFSDLGEMKKMGARGKKLAHEKFDTEVVAKQMILQYRSIVQTGKPLSQKNSETLF